MEIPPITKIPAVVKKDINKWGHLKHIHLSPLHGNIDLLERFNAPADLEPLKVYHAPKKDNPFAVSTRLG